MLKQYVSIMAILLVAPICSFAIELMPETIKAQVAGYKAAFTCSATFNAGKSFEMIKDDELSGIRVDYRVSNGMDFSSP